MTFPAIDAVVLCNVCALPIQDCRCERAPYSEGDPLVADYSGVFKIGDIELRCHVLNNGIRVIDAEDIERLFS